MIRYINVAGTFGAMHPDDWFHPKSNLSKFLSEHGCEPAVVDPMKRYMWSTEVDGIHADHSTWDAAGRALAHYIVPPLFEESLIKPIDTFVIAHSHGGNVVAYACGKYGLKINGLITVGTPIRRDLYAVYQAANSQISRHLHLYAGWRDYWQLLGSLFDGKFGLHREHPFAEWNDEIKNGNHGCVLRDKAFFPLWLERGWVDYWTGKALSGENQTSEVNPCAHPQPHRGL